MKKMFLKKTCYLLLVVLSILALAGCQNREKEDASSDDDLEVPEDTSSQEDIGQQEEAPEQEQTEHPEEVVRKQFSFADLSNLEFCFSSGAGGWRTVMYIHEDGTFEGNYRDSDMGDTGLRYPGGVEYVCNFNGKFTQPQRVSSYAYSTEVEYIKTEKQAGTEEIIDGICYRYSEPYGLDSAKEFHIYEPGVPLRELPEGFRSWVGFYDLDSIPETRLQYYGLYNVTPKYGFSSYEAVNTETERVVPEASSTKKYVPDSIDAELATIEAKAEEINNQLQNNQLTQMEMNLISAERYQLWDDELNSIWSRLKEKLDDTAMATLTEEERAWISYKESEVAAVGEECGGGSLQPLLENDRAAELTRDRVYELAELLR